MAFVLALHPQLQAHAFFLAALLLYNCCSVFYALPEIYCSIDEFLMDISFKHIKYLLICLKHGFVVFFVQV